MLKEFGNLLTSLDRRVTIGPESLEGLHWRQLSREILLDDVDTLDELSRPRAIGDYSLEGLIAHPNTPPVVVWRGLLDRRSIEGLIEANARVSEAIGTEANLRINITGWPIEGKTDERGPIIYPLHLTTAIDYGGHTIRTPILVSSLHNVMTSNQLLDDEKGEITNSILGMYKRNAPISIASMPERTTVEVDIDWLRNGFDHEPIKSGLSPTHHYLLRAGIDRENPEMIYRRGEVVGKPFLFYYLDPSKTDLYLPAYSLYEDEGLHQAGITIANAWNGNFTRYATERTPEQDAIFNQQTPAMIQMLKQMIWYRHPDYSSIATSQTPHPLNRSNV